MFVLNIMSLCFLQLTNLKPTIPTLIFLFPPTCRRSVKRISWSGSGALRDVPTPPRGWARNKIRWLALLRLCPSCGNGMLNSIAIGVSVHGRVWRRRNVCLFGVVVWGYKEMNICFLSNDWEGNKLKIWLQTTLQKMTRLQLLLREILPFFKIYHKQI